MSEVHVSGNEWYLDKYTEMLTVIAVRPNMVLLVNPYTKSAKTTQLSSVKFWTFWLHAVMNYLHYTFCHSMQVQYFSCSVNYSISNRVHAHTISLSHPHPHAHTHTMKKEKIPLKVIMQMYVSRGFLLEHASQPKVIMPTNNSTVTSNMTVETNKSQVQF